MGNTDHFLITVVTDCLSPLIRDSIFTLNLIYLLTRLTYQELAHLNDISIQNLEEKSPFIILTIQTRMDIGWQIRMISKKCLQVGKSRN